MILEIFYFQQGLYFKTLDRVIFFDNDLNLLGDTDTLDLRPKIFFNKNR